MGAHSQGRYFAETATHHAKALLAVARPDLHLIRGAAIPESAREAIRAKRVPARFGEWRYGYARRNNRPDPRRAIQVTAQWSCQAGSGGDLDELLSWWQRVGTDAHSMEEGLLRFEAYQVSGEDALIIHETFEDTKDLKFHLTKGTADKYKKEIDAIAAPECYYFRGPVSWTIRTYSKFMRRPPPVPAVPSLAMVRCSDVQHRRGSPAHPPEMVELAGGAQRTAGSRPGWSAGRLSP